MILLNIKVNKPTIGMIEVIAKLRRIWRDHQAMNHVRAGNGDVQLVTVVVQSSGFDCYLFQKKECVFNQDPAVAIIESFETEQTNAK
jgi:hypothetical protein